MVGGALVLLGILLLALVDAPRRAYYGITLWVGHRRHADGSSGRLDALWIAGNAAPGARAHPHR
jgi:hypothetical protein